MAHRQQRNGSNVQPQTDPTWQLAGDESAEDCTSGPARLQEAKPKRAGMQDVIGQSHQNYVCAYHAGHYCRVRDSQRAH